MSSSHDYNDHDMLMFLMPPLFPWTSKTLLFISQLDCHLNLDFHETQEEGWSRGWSHPDQKIVDFFQSCATLFPSTIFMMCDLTKDAWNSICDAQVCWWISWNHKKESNCRYRSKIGSSQSSLNPSVTSETGAFSFGFCYSTKVTLKQGSSWLTSDAFLRLFKRVKRVKITLQIEMKGLDSWKTKRFK